MIEAEHREERQPREIREVGDEVVVEVEHAEVAENLQQPRVSGSGLAISVAGFRV